MLTDRSNSSSKVLSNDRNLYGFVYDSQGAYTDTRGRTYLINNDGETNQDELKRQVPDRYKLFVQSLLR